MNDFYVLTPSELADRYSQLAHEALTRWGLEAQGLHVLKMRENAVFRVDLAGGARRVLRIHRHGYHSDPELASELEWMRALAQDGIAVPEIVPALDGALFIAAASAGVPEPRQVDLFNWIDGTPLGSAEVGIAASDAEIAALYRTLGVLAAHLHRHAEHWRRPAGFVRHAWDHDGLLGAQPFWGRFWELAALSGAERRLIDRARAAADADLARFGRATARYGLIHADLVPENVMVGGGRLRIIDFDDAGFGWYLFELATALYFHVEAPYFDIARAALIEGYCTERALDDADLAALPLFLLLRGFTYLGWVHTRQETETAREFTPTLVRLACRVAEDYLTHARPR